MTHLALVGPTASGKSALAFEYARRAGDVEIVSMDSMQVYRGMDIGTAKPSVAQRSEVRHHLVDVADPHEDWSLARVQHEARAAVRAVEARGRRALLVGGTGLYVRAVIDPLCIPPEDPVVGTRIEADLGSTEGLARGYARLSRSDPAAAARIEPGNARRIARALEVLELTGRPFSSFGPGLDVYGRTVFPVRLAGLWPARAGLARRIDARVDAMREAGLAREVHELVRRPRGWSRTARQAIGYKELADRYQEPADRTYPVEQAERTPPSEPEGQNPVRRVAASATMAPGATVCSPDAAFEPDTCAPNGVSADDLDRAFAEVRRRTRRFARRQRVWFRRDPRITWFAASGNTDAMLGPLGAWWDP